MILALHIRAWSFPISIKPERFTRKCSAFADFGDEGWQNNRTVDKAIGVAGSACKGYTLAGHNCYLELFEFSAPKQEAVPHELGPHDLGIRHLAFFVDDCRAEYQRLLDLGGDVLGEPTDLGGGIYAVYAGIHSAISSSWLSCLPRRRPAQPAGCEQASGTTKDE